MAKVVTFWDLRAAIQDLADADIGPLNSKLVIDEYIDQRIDLVVERLLLANPDLKGRPDDE